jgi:hypothetical protein
MKQLHHDLIKAGVDVHFIHVPSSTYDSRMPDESNYDNNWLVLKGNESQFRRTLQENRFDEQVSMHEYLRRWADSRQGADLGMHQEWQMSDRLKFIVKQCESRVQNHYRPDFGRQAPGHRLSDREFRRVQVEHAYELKDEQVTELVASTATELDQAFKRCITLPDATNISDIKADIKRHLESIDRDDNRLHTLDHLDHTNNCLLSRNTQSLDRIAIASVGISGRDMFSIIDWYKVFCWAWEY